MLYDPTHMRYLEAVRLRETERKMVVGRGWGAKGMGNCLMCIEFHFCETKFWRLVAQSVNPLTTTEVCT